MNRRKRHLGAALLIAVIVLSGCLEFKSIEQPSSILPGELFTVLVEVTVEGAEESGYPIGGVCLPMGWTIPGDTAEYSGAYRGSITYDPNLSLEQEDLSPAPEGYYWWVGRGSEVAATDAGTVFMEVPIQADLRPGRYSLEYLLDSGPSHYGLRRAERSDRHMVEVVDEWTPRELNALPRGSSVVLAWLPPWRRRDWQDIASTAMESL